MTRDDLAKILGNKGVEIGTNHGKYASILCQANPNLKLTCVDPYVSYVDGHLVDQQHQDRIYAEAKRTLEKFNIKILRISSMEALKYFEDKSLDFCYIDGNHAFDFVMSDIIFWSQKVRKGGIVAVHDYHDFKNLRHSGGFSACKGKDVIMAVDTYVYCHNINSLHITDEKLPTAFWVN